MKVCLYAGDMNVNRKDEKQYVEIQKKNDFLTKQLGRVAQSVGYLTRKSGVLGSIPSLATYVRFWLLAKVCARSTG